MEDPIFSMQNWKLIIHLGSETLKFTTRVPIGWGNNHQRDKAYDNVILHIVRKADAEVRRTMVNLYRSWSYRCPMIFRHDTMNWFLPASGLHVKINYSCYLLYSSAAGNRPYSPNGSNAKQLLSNCCFRSRKTTGRKLFYISLARSFGFSTNSQPFETMAKSLPLSVLARHKG